MPRQPGEIGSGQMAAGSLPPSPQSEALETEHVQHSASAAGIYARGLALNSCVSPWNLHFDLSVIAVWQAPVAQVDARD